MRCSFPHKSILLHHSAFFYCKTLSFLLPRFALGRVKNTVYILFDNPVFLHLLFGLSVFFIQRGFAVCQAVVLLDLIDYCKKNDILVEAYSPVAHGEMLKNSRIADMATKYGVSVPQLCIRYCLQLGTLPLPKTANSAHMADNAQMSFEISNEDMETLKNAEKIKNYGDFSMFPVFGGKMAADGSCSPQDFPHKK